MFQNVDKEGLFAKEALAGEIMENETTEVVKETLARSNTYSIRVFTTASSTI